MRITTRGTLTLSIDAAIFRQFPALRIGALIVTSLDRAAASLSSAQTREAWTISAEALAAGGITRENLTSAAPVDEWRNAFATCGVSPSRHQPGVESVVRRALAHERPGALVPMEDLCGALAARHLVPLSGHDLDALPSCDIALRAARPSRDWFLPLGAAPAELPLSPSVIVYAAGATVLAWSFNHRDSRQTCVHSATTRAVFLSEAITPRQATSTADALEELRIVLTTRGAHAAAPFFADRGTPSTSVQLDAEDDESVFGVRNPGGDTTP